MHSVKLAPVDRLVLVPRWGGTAAHDFYPWLVEQVPGIEVAVCALAPSAGAPSVADTMAALAAVLGREPARLATTIVMGHSVGGQAALRTLAALASGLRVRGLLYVAGWWTVDRPWESLLPWQSAFDWTALADRVGAVRVLISDDDPYTSDWQETRRLFEQRVAATVTVVPGGRHFNATPQPQVVSELAALAAAPFGDVAAQAGKR
jgi:predicted alpha/beta hydrolase family esterase